MKSARPDGPRVLQEAAEQAVQIRIQLTDDYLALIARVEAMPQNQSGADKTERWLGARSYREFFRHAASSRSGS